MSAKNQRSLLDVLTATRLLTSERLEAVARETHDDVRPRDVLAGLVSRGWITPWQARQIQAGRTNFFLGKYRLLDVLGRGGMGVVFLAEQPIMRRRVAIKILPQALLDNPVSVARFLREIRLAASLDHPNVVAAYDAGCIGGRHFLVMEAVSGRNLREWKVSCGELPVPWLCECICQALSGLEHAEQQGVVHRDLKPSNLLIVGSDPYSMPHVKILDMGLSLLLADVAGEALLTRADQLVGTANYMAPEQARNSRGVDVRADLYSLGCILYEMLTDRLPFDGRSVTEQLVARTSLDPLPLDRFRRDLPPALVAVVMRMLARDPARRYQSPAELQQALVPFALRTQPAAPAPASPGVCEDLQRFLRTMSTELDEPRSVVKPRSSRSWSLRLLLIGAAALVGSVVAGAALMAAP